MSRAGRAAITDRWDMARLLLPAAWLLTRPPLLVLALVLGSRTDITYLHYGQAMAAGAVPYRDFAVEYPPLAIAFLAIPALTAHSFTQLSATSYSVFFGLQALLLDALLYAVLARWAGTRAALWYLLLSLIGGSLLQTFELLPAALTTTAVLMRQQGRNRCAWLLLAVAAATKGWPLLLAPLFLVLDMQSPRRLATNVGLSALLFAVLILPSLLGGVIRAEQGLAFHAKREPEVETVYANVAMVAHDALRIPARVFTGRVAAVPEAHSSNVSSALPGWPQLPHLMLVVLLVLGLLRTLPRVRGNVAMLPSSAAFLVGLFMLGFSVLETQYILWLAPLVALVLARAAPSVSRGQAIPWVRLGGAISLICFAVFGHLLRIQWNSLLAMQPGAVGMAIVRNACLVLALVFLWRCIPSTVQHQDAEFGRARQGRPRLCRSPTLPGSLTRLARDHSQQ